MIPVAPLTCAGIIIDVFRIPFRAGVAKSVDAVDSKSTVEIRAGSSPAFGIQYLDQSTKPVITGFSKNYRTPLHGRNDPNPHQKLPL